MWYPNTCVLHSYHELFWNEAAVSPLLRLCTCSLFDAPVSSHFPPVIHPVPTPSCAGSTGWDGLTLLNEKIRAISKWELCVIIPIYKLWTTRVKCVMCTMYVEMELQVLCLLIARLFLPLAATFPQQFTQYSPHPVQGVCWNCLMVE